MSGDLKLLQGKPCVHLGESGYKLTKPLTGGAGGVGMGKSYLFLALGALTVFNQQTLFFRELLGSQQN